MPDHLMREQRHRAMASVKLKDRPLEMAIRSELHRRGYRFRKHVRQLPGSPDLVFTKEKVAAFIDGDFWHGYRFPSWEHKLTRFWRDKIRTNRERDLRNFKKLRRMGWRLVRIWQHEIKRDTSSCIARIISVLRENRNGRSRRSSHSR